LGLAPETAPFRKRRPMLSLYRLSAPA
jgi:hypothetical protein